MPGSNDVIPREVSLEWGAAVDCEQLMTTALAAA